MSVENLLMFGLNGMSSAAHAVRIRRGSSEGDLTFQMPPSSCGMKGDGRWVFSNTHGSV